MSNTAMDVALRRLVNRLRKQAVTEAAAAAAGMASAAADEAAAAVDAHADQRQFIHGIGPLYVAKTTRADQFVDWKDLKGTPPLGGTGIDPETLEIDAAQITTGTMALQRLPVAAPGEGSSQKLVRADDPRLSSSRFVSTTAEFLAAGDFVQSEAVGGQVRMRRAAATLAQAGGAIGFVAEARGANEAVTVYPQGENAWTYLPGVTLADLGKIVYLSTEPGKVGLTPPTGAGQLIQPLGSIVGVVSATVAIVLVRYEFRFRL